MLRVSYLNTMRGLEDGLRVGDIAVFDLQTCEENELVSTVKNRVARWDLDNVPVRRNGSIVGVVEDIKAFSPHARVANITTALSDDKLIAASVPLASFLPAIANLPYRLVVAESGIAGVVTPSDVVQLPVRLLVFALLAHLEEVMRAVIRQTQPDDERAVLKLEPERLKKIRKTLRLQKRKGLNPAALDVTQFNDKATLLFNLEVVQEKAGDRELFDAFYDLRNKVDHVDTYAETPEQLQTFLAHVRELESWIDRLTQLLPADAPAVLPPRR